jgi:hypothetical protein|tara:strand:- start:161 stop:418 length:258 start_codon:yes stop_codon:yes gene_type:complete
MKNAAVKLDKDFYMDSETGEHIYKQSTYPNAVTKYVDGESVFFPEGITPYEWRYVKKQMLKQKKQGNNGIMKIEEDTKAINREKD